MMREGKCIRRTSLLTAVIEDGYHSNFLINPNWGPNAVGFEIFHDTNFIIQNSFSCLIPICRNELSKIFDEKN